MTEHCSRSPAFFAVEWMVQYRPLATPSSSRLISKPSQSAECRESSLSIVLEPAFCGNLHRATALPPPRPECQTGAPRHDQKDWFHQCLSSDYRHHVSRFAPSALFEHFGEGIEIVLFQARKLLWGKLWGWNWVCEPLIQCLFKLLRPRCAGKVVCEALIKEIIMRLGFDEGRSRNRVKTVEISGN